MCASVGFSQLHNQPSAPAHGIEWKKKCWTTPGFKVEVADLFLYSYKTNLQEALTLWAASTLSWVSFGEKHNQVLPNSLHASQCKERKVMKIMEVQSNLFLKSVPLGWEPRRLSVDGKVHPQLFWCSSRIGVYVGDLKQRQDCGFLCLCATESTGLDFTVVPLSGVLRECLV